eukprot:755849-Hanusia_phi.AAC.2
MQKIVEMLEMLEATVNVHDRDIVCSMINYGTSLLLSCGIVGEARFPNLLQTLISPVVRGEIFCEGDYLNWNDLNNLARMAVDES